MRRLVTVCILLCAASLSLLASPAGGDVFGPISLVSLRPTGQAGFGSDQASSAEQPALSGDGRYVAFTGSFGGEPGVWRRDLQTGAVEHVAPGAAELPSISRDGRYVSFTTTANLTAGDNSAGPDVYVRDMDIPASGPCEPPPKPCAFELVSAVNGSEEGLTYLPKTEGEAATKGSLASGRSALSADGRRVAFVTTVISDLTGQRPPATPETPALQVAVRDLSTKQTELVSVLYDPATGKPAVNPTTGLDEPVPTETEGKEAGAVLADERFPPSAGASISADGSTVAWMGQEIAKQAGAFSGIESLAEYSEPLWRRIADGAQAPTRRVTGGSDPAGAACAASGETQLTLPPTLADPCQGPFDAQSTYNEARGIRASVGSYLPQLSSDGLTVAFLASARYLAGGEEFASGTAGRSNDLYVVDMRDGSTRVTALRRLTEIGSGSFATEGANAPVVDLAVSPDGSQIALTTLRTVFPLGSPAYISPPAATPGAQELFDVDLSNDTITRVTQSYEGKRGEPAGALANSPSFSADGGTLAFASTADNLVYGDGNRASDVFVVSRKRFVAEAVTQYISPAPASPAIEPDWLLGVSAATRRDGSILLEVAVPGSGTLSADAVGDVPLTAARSSRFHRRRRHGARAGVRRSPTVAARNVASAAGASPGEGLVALPLTLSPHFASLATKRGGFSATVSVAFAAAGHRVLRGSIEVSFVRTEPLRARHARSRRTAVLRAGLGRGGRR